MMKQLSGTWHLIAIPPGVVMGIGAMKIAYHLERWFNRDCIK